jgi:hypothetical protein
MIPNSRPVTQNIAFGSEVPSSTRLADTYSDSLMDDLFLDVDRILEGDLSSYMTVVGHTPKPITPSTRVVQLPSNFAPQSAADIYRATLAASAEVVSSPSSSRSSSRHSTGQRQPARPVSYSGGGRPVTARGSFHSNIHSAEPPAAELYTTTLEMQPHLQPPSAQYLYAHEAMSELTLTDVSPRPPQTIFEPQRQPQVSLPFLLMGAAGISAVSTLGLWTLSHSAPSNSWLLSLTREAAAAELPSRSDEDFLAYLEQSLNVISAQQAEATEMVSAVIPVVNNTPTLPTTVPNVNAAPTLGALPNLPGAPASSTASPSVIERVFVPVYQNSQTAQAAPSAPLPSLTLPRNAPRPTVPVPAPVAAAAAIPPGAPVAATASVPMVRSSTSLPAPSATVATAPTNGAVNALTNTTPTSEHALVGILNLGSRSAALFDVDGSSQRAYVGDRIGVSGWTLVSVNGQDVVVRREGEVRSIYIGQRF